MEKQIKISKIRDIKQLPFAYIDGNFPWGMEFEPFNNITPSDIEKLRGAKNVRLVYEVKTPILDEKEKEYLGNLIRPFRNKVKSIAKHKYYTNNEEFIRIELVADTSICLPNFKIGNMYKGMGQDKPYTLKELEL